MQVTYLQLYAYKVANLGYNMFITGKAGTGKTTIISKYIADKEKEGYNVMKLAPTGLAASSINGVTLHSEFKIPIGVLTNKYNSYDITDDNLVESDIVVVEEVSMCRVDLFDFLCNKILKANAIRKRRGLKTIQLILVGDFFQLPPVITDSDRFALENYYKTDIGGAYAFQSKFWSMFDFKYVILDEIVRQDNIEFMTQLNNVREGNKSSLDYFYKNACKTEIPGAITLCGKNSEANDINNREINKLAGDIVEYRAILDGEVNHNDTIAEFNLQLKLGARVMMLTNKDDYHNGSFGYITGFDSDKIEVRLDTGSLVEVERFTWEIYRYDLEEDPVSKKNKLVRKVVGTFTQFPLKLAYAITIHKSQGQTYDYANLSPYCWDCGQLYVALSRIRKIENLHINYDIDNSYAVVSLSVIKFHNEIAKIANQEITKPKEEKLMTMDDDMNKIQNLLKFSN